MQCKQFLMVRISQFSDVFRFGCFLVACFFFLNKGYTQETFENSEAIERITCRTPSLLECLHQLTPEADSHSHLTDLGEVHQQWIHSIISFVQENKNAPIIFYPQDTQHPIYHFDQQDAEVILKPIFQHMAHFELTDEMISRIFFEQVSINKDDANISPIDYFKMEKVKSETYRIAKKTYDLVQENTLILLGQTPAYVGEMVKTISAHCAYHPTIIHVPFSGRPNYLCKLSYKKLWPTAFLDIVTPLGEKRFRALLEKAKLSPERLREKTEKIYLLDNSSGASVACFLAFFKKWCDESETCFPDFVFLEMCDASDFTILNEQGEWIPASTPHLVFDTSLRFDIPVIFLGMQDDILNSFDKIHDNLRIVASFNGIHWSKKYLAKNSLNYPTTEAKKLMSDYQDYAKKSLPLETNEPKNLTVNKKSLNSI